MHLIQLLLPARNNAGQPFPRETYAGVRAELVARFGGLTAFTRAPATGLWAEDGDTSAVVKDEIVVYEVMADTLDRAWWGAYRCRLEAVFAQHELVIRAQAVEML